MNIYAINNGYGGKRIYVGARLVIEVNRKNSMSLDIHPDASTSEIAAATAGLVST